MSGIGRAGEGRPDSLISADAMAVLRVIEGKTNCSEYLLGDSTTIGRGEDNAVRILDETSSRRHAEIRREGGGFGIEDLKSSNGTYVNGRKTAKSALSDGDEIVVGSVRFSFHAQSPGSKETVIVGSGDDLKVKSTVEASDCSLSDGKPGSVDAEILRKAIEIQSMVTQSLDPEEVMDRLCEALLKHVGGDRAAVLAASKSGEVELLAVRSATRSGGSRFILSRAIIGEVVTAGKALLISDSARDPVFQGRESIINQGVSTAVCVPVAEAGKVAALVYLDRTGEAAPFTDRDLRMAAAFTEQAAQAIRNARKFSMLSQHARNLEKVLTGGSELVGKSPSFLDAVETAKRVAGTDSTVLICGETGTGKELIARLIHNESFRRSKPFIPVNCAALVGSLLESELFGHEKGAFTGADRRKPGMFELADGGTLFLDEIGEMAPEVQAKLLRAIQDKAFYRVGGTVPVDVDLRLLAATNRDLKACVESGGFRADLYYRLSVVAIEIPPLRKRQEDIVPLAEHFLKKCAAKTGRPADGFAPEALSRFGLYSWPGNVRELENVIERAVVLSRSRTIGPELIPVPGEAASCAPQGGMEVMTMKEAEKRAIIAALNHTGFKKGEAARILDISWPTLNKKIEEYGIVKDS